MEQIYMLSCIPGKTFTRAELVEIWNRLIACEWDNRVGLCPTWWSDQHTEETIKYTAQALSPIILEIEMLTSEYERSCYANTVMNGMRKQTFDRLWRGRLSKQMSERVLDGVSFSLPVILHEENTVI